MSRWLVGMSGDKDAMIAHLEKCEKRMLKQFEEIRTIALNVHPSKLTEEGVSSFIREIVLLCDVYLDRRSDKQKMQDQIDEMQKRIEKMGGDSECGCC